MRHRAFLLAFFSLAALASTSAGADSHAYSGTRDLSAKAGDVTCTHHHDWSLSVLDERYQRVLAADPEAAAHMFAHVECKRDGKPLFKKVSPALTYLWVSPDARFVVGLSTIRLRNPAQLIIYDMSGRRLFASLVPSMEACFTQKEYAAFIEAHPKVKNHFAGRSVIVGERVYAPVEHIDGDESAFTALFARKCPGHLVRHITQSVTNWVFWYGGSSPSRSREPQITDPKLQIDVDEKGEPVALQMLDVAGEPAVIDLRPTYAH